MMFRTIPFAVAVALTATPVLAQETTPPAAPATILPHIRVGLSGL
jgi:hypothetical protein